MRTNNKYAISFGAGGLKVGVEPRISLWCLDNNCQSCSVIVPESSNNQIDSIVTKYANDNNVGTTIGCQMLNTDSPILTVVSMSIPSYHKYFEPLSHYMLNHLQPPLELANEFLNNVVFAVQDQYIVRLKRISKNYEKEDLFTTLKNGDKVEMFSLLDNTIKPISTWELYKSKIKNLFGIYL